MQFIQPTKTITRIVREQIYRMVGTAPDDVPPLAGSATF